MDASIADFSLELQNRGFSDEVIQKFKDHQINQEAFLELTECEFKEMEIKIGPRKLLLKLIREMQSLTSTESIIGQYVVCNNGTLLPNKNESENTANHFNPVMINDSDAINDPGILNFPNSSHPSTSRCNLTEGTWKLIPGECNQVTRPVFTRYDTVENTLRNHRRGENIITAARQSFSDQDRRALLRILVSELIQVHGYYPPVETKIALAEAIVKEFPLLKDCQATKGYEHYFDEESRRGFIEYRLWTVRRNLHPSDKKYKKKMSQSGSTNPHSSSDFIKEEWDEQISWMKFTNPDDSSKTEIKMYMKETMENRRDWITKEGPTINEIFTKYPRLLDYKGEMMSTEFGHLFPDKKDNFIQKFPSYYQPRILEYAKQRNYDVYKKFSHISDDTLKALLILLELIPNNNAYQKKTDQTVPNIKGETQSDRGIKRKKEDMENDELDKTDYSCKTNQLFQTVPEGTDVMEYAKEVAACSKTAEPAPYVIIVKGQRKESFIIQIDRFFLIPANDNAISSFNLLFQCYFVLNVKYPPELHNFFSFIERYIYNIETKVRGIVASLHVNIRSVTLQVS